MTPGLSESHKAGKHANVNLILLILSMTVRDAILWALSLPLARDAEPGSEGSGAGDGLALPPARGLDDRLRINSRPASA